MVTIIDIVNDDAFYMDKFLQIAKEAEQSNDTLSNNYRNISEDYKKYKCFTLVLEDDEPVAFSGVQRYNENLIRGLTRTYYAKSVRKGNLSPRKLPNLASKYMLPFQFKYGQDNGYYQIIISFEATLKREKFAHLFANMLNKSQVCGPYKYWSVPPYLFNTCKDQCDKPECWQHVVITELEARTIWGFTTPNINLPRRRSVDHEIE